MKTVLISLSDKTGIVPFAEKLIANDYRIISTGGTLKHLQQAQIPVIPVSDITHFPEILDGRVKTLHPHIHGGILARPDQDQEVLQQHQIQTIDMVVVNLYPFAETISKPDCTPAQAIEKIDIGGPTMIRAAAKNHRYVTVIVEPEDYVTVGEQLNGEISIELRRQLAAKAFAHTANYEQTIANWFHNQSSDKRSSATSSTDAAVPDFIEPPQNITIHATLNQSLRYGENPHQPAAYYQQSDYAEDSCNFNNCILHQGKPLSYNNIMDFDIALETLKKMAERQVERYAEPQAESQVKPDNQGSQENFATCVIIKHATPTAIASDSSLINCYQKAFHADSTSAFGGIIGFNRSISPELAKIIIDTQFAEIILAPKFTQQALQIFANKPNIRLLEYPPMVATSQTRWSLRQVNGGVLYQQTDNHTDDIAQWQVVTDKQPSSEQWDDLRFAWNAVKVVKSNAIVLAKNRQTIGIGGGQTSRIDSTRLALLKAQDAKLSLAGAIISSDAFFPFADSVEQIAQYNISGIIQPGGSLRDDEVIQAANEHQLFMIFTGFRHFYH